jgi:pyruvate,water dikinase
VTPPGLIPLDAPDPDPAVVGGKAYGLAKLLAAGLPVPPGVIIPATAVRTDPALRSAILDAAQRLGGPVAVRSSATAEDSSAASLAGQHATTLNVSGGAILAAVDRCWRSHDAAAAVAYRRERGIAAGGMAVIVQRMLAPDAAGVLFTRDPLDPARQTIVIEATRGPGEAVVSGAVTPDRFAVDRDTGAIASRPPSPVLSDTQVSRLADLGRRCEAVFGAPQDVEWAVVGDEPFVLQSRPITAGADRERVRAEVIDQLRAASPRPTAWVRDSVAESLPEPTPMSWAVMQRLLSADGGTGAMHRDLGGDPAFEPVSGYDLVAGRPMANLDRLPRVQFRRPPVSYRPGNPRPVPDPLRHGWRRLPGVLWRADRVRRTTRRAMATFPDRFPAVAAEFAAWARRLLAEDWSRFDAFALVELFRRSVERVMVEFGREALKPTVFAELAWQELEARVGAEAVAEAAAGAVIPPECDVGGAVRQLASGELPREVFLERFGHRGPNELELGAPRWGEVPVLIQHGVIARTSHGQQSVGFGGESVAAKRLQTFITLREMAKHHLLLGVAVLRRLLLELDARFALHGGIFFLTPAELRPLVNGDDFTALIAERRKRRRLELGLEVPAVLRSDDLAAVGRPLPPVSEAVLQGLGLSPGVAEGPAVVLTDPAAAPPGDGFILVCPSTDPGWVPVMVRAKGLVTAAGGALSHGAIVARELGLPAVGGISGLRDGQLLRIDGTSGRVEII